MTSIEGAPLEEEVRAPVPGTPKDDARIGIIAALVTYTLWGVLPIFFKFLEHVDPAAVVANRILFSFLFVAALFIFRRRLGEVRQAFANRRAVMALSLSAVLIGGNWLLFIWAIGNGHVLEASFGYFINPLMNVALGMVLLSERLTRTQTIAIAIAVIAVLVQAVGLGTMPWISLGLAGSFAIYGYVRKTVNVESAAGLMIETAVLAPLSLIYIGWLLLGPQPALYADPATTFLLMMTGPATAIPLLLFAFSARRLKYSTIGMLQYIAPSLMFVTAVLVFGEDLVPARLISFALIWVSLVVFSYGVFRERPRHA